MSIFKRLKRIVTAEIDSRLNSNEGKTTDFQSSYEEVFKETFGNQSNETESRQHASQNSKEAEYYANLELPYGASFTEVKKAYRKLQRQYHPDKFQGDSEREEFAQKISAKLNEAYEYFENKNKGKQ